MCRSRSRKRCKVITTSPSNFLARLGTYWEDSKAHWNRNRRLEISGLSERPEELLAPVVQTQTPSRTVPEIKGSHKRLLGWTNLTRTFWIASCHERAMVLGWYLTLRTFDTAVFCRNRTRQGSTRMQNLFVIISCPHYDNLNAISEVL